MWENSEFGFVNSFKSPKAGLKSKFTKFGLSPKLESKLSFTQSQNDYNIKYKNLKSLFNFREYNIIHILKEKKKKEL